MLLPALALALAIVVATAIVVQQRQRQEESENTMPKTRRKGGTGEMTSTNTLARVRSGIRYQVPGTIRYQIPGNRYQVLFSASVTRSQVTSHMTNDT